MTMTVMLARFHPAQSLIITVDASLYEVGIVLTHWDKNGQILPVSLASHQLHVAEQRYVQVDKEGLALLLWIEHINQYLWGRKFKRDMDLNLLLGPQRAVPVQASLEWYGGP
ncbi:hypothetical protein MTO96_035187 [Rhipicephalus appendiculatus]